MTSKTSLFNKGIYKSTVKRFAWGSVLYFILLFMSTAFVMLMRSDYLLDREYKMPGRLIFDQSYMIFPIALALCVPTVVALLIFRFVHSKKQSIFVHSIPVSRTANYISSCLAGFTLMCVPVLLNGIILGIISMTEFSKLVSFGASAAWVGINFLILFVMFAYAAFASVITGSSVAAVVLNALLHVFLMVFAAGFEQMADAFIYGYSSDFKVLRFLIDNLPLTWLAQTFSQMEYAVFRENFTALKVILHIGAAVVFYFLAYLLYRKRKVENCGEVAGFACLNPIFKYLATALAALGTFGVFCGGLEESRLMVAILVVIASAIVYFAGEMLLKKTLRVWRSYKGYLGFAVCGLAVFWVFAFTDFFGYESFVPDLSDVESITMYEYYSGTEPWVSDGELKGMVVESHRILANQAHTLNCWMRVDDDKYLDRSYITIGYKMKDGDEIKRRYPVSFADKRAMMSELYKSESYKMAALEVFSENIDELVKIRIDRLDVNEETELSGDEAKELFECIKSDTLGFTYDEDVIDYGTYFSAGAEIRYIPKTEEDAFGARETVVLENDAKREAVVYSMWLNINSNYQKTLAWLRDNGYGNPIAYAPIENMYIYKYPEAAAHNNVSNVGNSFPSVIDDFDAVEASEKEKFDAENYIKLTEEDKTRLLEYSYTARVHDQSSDVTYSIYFTCNGEISENDCNIFMTVAENELPEFLKKYLQR